MIKKIGLGLIVLVLAFVAVIAFQPSEFILSTSLKMDSPPPTVFSKVNDFHHWPEWSPWAELDPEMKTEFAGEPWGVGAIYKWSGNDQVGIGQMTITESVTNAKVGIKLEFEEPMKAESTTEIVLEGDGPGTLVTWTMKAQHSFFEKAMCLVMNGKKMMTEQFDKGLAKLKETSEKAHADAQESSSL